MTHASPTLPNLSALRTAITAMQSLCDRQPDEATWLAATGAILSALIAQDTWLPDSHAVSDAHYFQQHALHIDPAQRFSISSFVWGPGQGTPVHNHTIAGWVGVLRGAELCQRFTENGATSLGPAVRLDAGQIDAVSPHDAQIGDVHSVRNAFEDRNSVSIHIYRGDISRIQRSVFAQGEQKPFQSSYSAVPTLL